SFLTAVDSKIEQLNKKKALLEQYKKGMMQKLFSQELRFKDEQGNEFPDWEKKPFVELLISVPTKKHQVKSSEILSQGSYPVVDQGKKNIVGYSNEKSKVFLTDGVIVYGDHTTIIKYVDFAFIVGADGTKVLKSIEDNIVYLFHCLCFYNVKAEGYKRHYSILKQINLPIPSLEEQQKIADFLSSIDKKTNLISTELTHAQSFKKSLLQQMFI
ncbi:restriction endonuclease subunit S, partial [Desulfobulbus sp. TB]|nr:restriction endonuclease subunit S [Desulfobulbus sp. TB]